MKIYFAAGLREIAKNSGYNGSTLKSLEQCSNFKRTHNFLLQVWEAMFRQMLHTYLASKPNSITTDVNCILQLSVETKKSPLHTINRIRELVEDTHTDEGFKNFIDQMSEADQTWKLWNQFVFRDLLSYYGLYLSIRCSNWELRVACLKQMVPVFMAFDREYYARIIPDHLAQVLQYPPEVLHCFEKGAFTVNLTGHPTRAVALNEAHEMCISKDMKTAVVCSTNLYLQKTNLFFNYCIKCYKNIINQLFPVHLDKQTETSSLLDSSPRLTDLKTTLNICVS